MHDMKTRNIGWSKAWLAVGAIGIFVVLPGCGASGDRASAPAETTASMDEPAPDDETDGLGSVSTGGIGGLGVGSGVGSGGGSTSGFGAGPRRNSNYVAAAPISTATAPGGEFESLLEEIDRKLASLPLANIAFNTPKTIPMGEAAVIELLVSLHEAEEQLRDAVRAAGPVETARVKVSPLLEASLAGAGFSIELVTPERQLLSSTQRTQWRWNIEPTKSDSLELTLTLSAHLTVDGQQSTRAIQTFERTISVDVPMSYRVSNFVSANQQWLITVLLVPVAGWLYRRYSSRKPPSDDHRDEQTTASRAA